MGGEVSGPDLRVGRYYRSTNNYSPDLVLYVQEIQYRTNKCPLGTISLIHAINNTKPYRWNRTKWNLNNDDWYVEITEAEWTVILMGFDGIAVD